MQANHPPHKNHPALTLPCTPNFFIIHVMSSCVNIIFHGLFSLSRLRSHPREAVRLGRFRFWLEVTLLLGLCVGEGCAAHPAGRGSAGRQGQKSYRTKSTLLGLAYLRYLVLRSHPPLVVRW